MKKIASLLLILIAFNSCTTDVTHNDPSLQGLKDGELWRASLSYAELSTSGGITIIGVTQHETVTLSTVSKNPGTYVLGQNTVNRAGFEVANSGDELSYSTGTGTGDGQIKIDEYDPEAMTITGTFRFNADNVTDNPEGGEVLNFQEGHFYKVKVVPAL
jgi:hypothetical protein